MFAGVKTEKQTSLSLRTFLLNKYAGKSGGMITGDKK